MKKILTGIILSLAVAVSSVQAEKYELDTAHSSINFSIKHMGISNAKGVFGSYKGDVEYDGKNESSFKLNLTIDVDSVDTRSKKRDAHLVNEDYFDAEKHPKMTFVTKSVKDGKLTGDMTIKGVTKEVVADIELSGPVDSPFQPGVKIIGFTGSATLKRHDFGVGHDGTSDALIGKDVKIEISLEAKK